MNLNHFLTPYTKNKLKVDEIPKCRQEAIKILEEKTDNNFFDLSRSSFLLDLSTEARETKAENELLEPHEDKKLLHSEGNNKQN